MKCHILNDTDQKKWLLNNSSIDTVNFSSSANSFDAKASMVSGCALQHRPEDILEQAMSRISDNDLQQWNPLCIIVTDDGCFRTGRDAGCIIDH